MPGTVKLTLLAALALGSVLLQGISVFYLLGDPGHGLAVSHSVHTFEGLQSPRSYFAWDWITRPEFMQKPSEISDTCREDEKYDCGLETWQFSDSCPEEEGTLSTHSLLKDQVNYVARKQFYSDQDVDYNYEPYVLKGESRISFPEHSYQQIATVCQHARVPRQINVIPNNHLSWGLFGSHSVIVLQYFIFSIFLILAVSEIMKEYRYSESTYMSNFKYMFSIGTWTLGIVFSFVFVRLLQDSTVKIEDVHYSYATPNASFTYGIIHLLLWALFCYLQTEDESNKNELTGSKDTFTQVSGRLGFPTKQRKQEIDMSTFKVGALRDSSKVDIDPMIPIMDFQLPDTVVGIKIWPVLQLVVLPLWFLIITTSGHTYNVDCKIQAMFAAAIVFSVVDIYTEALDSIFHTFLSTQGDLNELSSRSWRNETTLYFINFLVTAVQIFIVIFVNFQIGLSYENVVPGDDSTLVSQIDMSGLQFFNVYAGILIILKLIKLTYPGLRKWSVTGGARTLFFNGIDDLITFLFVSIVFVALMVNTGHLYQTENDIVNAMHRDVSEWNRLRSVWGAKMVPM